MPTARSALPTTGSKRHSTAAPRLAPRQARRSPLSTYPTISHAIPRRRKLTEPQKPHDFNVSISKSEILSGELHATFAGLYPLGSIPPDRERYSRWEALHPIRACTMPTDGVRDSISTTSESADTRQGQLGPRQPVRHYAPPHRPDASYSAPHRSAVSTRPQWPLFLSGVTPLSGVLHQLGASAMLPNWCNAP